jgi:dihydrofolate reductase
MTTSGRIEDATSTTRSVIVSENMTMNGVIEFADPWFDPGDQDDAELLDLQRRQMSTETALLLGRNTFEDFQGYWPDRTDDTSGSTDHLNRVSKYLVTSTVTDPDWANTTIVHPRSLLDTVQALKSQGSGDIGITGSIRVVHALLEADLVDELRLFVYPVITGRGRSLAPQGLPPLEFGLVAQREFPSGVVFQCYRRHTQHS